MPNAIAYNCFILKQKVSSSNSITHLEFRKKLILSLVEMHHQGYATPKRGRPVIVDVARLNERHFVKSVPSTEGRANRSRKCKVCALNGVRRDSRYQCSDCDVGLCVVPCFEIFHTRKNLKLK